MKNGRKPCPNKCDSEGMLHGSMCAACGGKGWVHDDVVAAIDVVSGSGPPRRVFEIKGEPKGSLDEKRVKLPGVVISAQCPQCKHVVKRDLARDGLDYPVMNKPFDYGFWCSECDREWDVKVVLTIRLNFYDPEQPKEKPKEKPASQGSAGRSHYHDLLDKAMDTTPEGSAFLGRFVDAVLREGHGP